jgi:acyl-coenzyme A thioesterase PaaI-like protein
MKLPGLLKAARRSRIARWWLNGLLGWMIPFNRPHGFKVSPLQAGGIRVDIPYWRINHNHIKGIHACALATAAEYCSGLALLEKLDAKQYRLIMKTLHMDYHYQAKARAHAVFAPASEELTEQVKGPLATNEAVLYTAVVELHDVKQNHLATGRITWQVKEWSKVRTKV